MGTNGWSATGLPTLKLYMHVLILNLLIYQKSTKAGNTGSHLETNMSQSFLATMKQLN